MATWAASSSCRWPCRRPALLLRALESLLVEQARVRTSRSPALGLSCACLTDAAAPAAAGATVRQRCRCGSAASAAALSVRQRCQCVPAALPARQTLALHRRQSLARPGEAGLDYYYMGGLSADRAPHRRSSAKRPRRSTRAWRLRAGESSRLPACGWGPCWALARAAPAQGISTRMQCHQLPGGGPEVLPCAA